MHRQVTPTTVNMWAACKDMMHSSYPALQMIFQSFGKSLLLISR